MRRAMVHALGASGAKTAPFASGAAKIMTWRLLASVIGASRRTLPLFCFAQLENRGFEESPVDLKER